MLYDRGMLRIEKTLFEIGHEVVVEPARGGDHVIGVISSISPHEVIIRDGVGNCHRVGIGDIKARRVGFIRS